MWITMEDVFHVPVDVNAAGAGDEEVVAAQGAGTRIVVVGYLLTVNVQQVTLAWLSGANPLSGAMVCQNGIPYGACDNKHGVLSCNDNEALGLRFGGAGVAAGHLVYGVQQWL